MHFPAKRSSRRVGGTPPPNGSGAPTNRRREVRQIVTSSPNPHRPPCACGASHAVLCLWAMARRHALLSSECLATMHLVILGTSGIKSEHSRIASGAQAWRCSGVPWAAALAKLTASRPAANNSLQSRRALRTILNFPLMRQPAQPRCTLEHDPQKGKPVFRKACSSLGDAQENAQENTILSGDSAGRTRAIRPARFATCSLCFPIGKAGL